MKQVSIFTDGACHGNPGLGGWAAILVHGTARREISGASPTTTNNRMEITAAIEALRALKEPCAVTLYTDSEYVCKAMREWLPKWKAKGWRRGKEPLKNVDLWQQLDEAASRHQIEWKWVRGHAGHPENERCDQLANEAAASLRDRSRI